MSIVANEGPCDEKSLAPIQIQEHLIDAELEHITGGDAALPPRKTMPYHYQQDANLISQTIKWENQLPSEVP
jgi:hypothetical protein